MLGGKAVLEALRLFADVRQRATMQLFGIKDYFSKNNVYFCSRNIKDVL